MTQHTTTTQTTLTITHRAIATVSVTALRAIPAVVALGAAAYPISAPEAWQQMTVHSATHVSCLVTVRASADLAVTRQQCSTAVSGALSHWLATPVTADIHIVALAADTETPPPRSIHRATD